MISVCIATHNGEKFIKEQVDSIIRQLGPEDEIVISDDGSTDSTLDILSDYNDPRIKVYQYKQPYKSRHPHSYVCKNFENALKQANGDFIFLADQDDYWMPNKVSICLDRLNDYTLVVHRAEFCNSKLIPSGKLMYKEEFVFKNYLSLKTGKYYGCTLAFRKELAKAILPFPKHLVIHDHWIGCMAELTGNVYYEKTPLIRYRIHGENTSGGTTKNSLIFQIHYRVYMFLHMMARFLKCNCSVNRNEGS